MVNAHDIGKEVRYPPTGTQGWLVGFLPLNPDICVIQLEGKGTTREGVTTASADHTLVVTQHKRELDELVYEHKQLGEKIKRLQRKIN